MLKKNTIFITILLAILLLPDSLFAQNQKMQFEHFKIEDGISQSTVQAIMQDKDGFIWLGTKYGLNRFDGYKFYVYNFSKKDSNTISDGFIRTIFQDSFGNLWIGTNNGLNKYSVEQLPDNTFPDKHLKLNLSIISMMIMMKIVLAIMK